MSSGCRLDIEIRVVSTQLWQFFEYPVRVEQAAAYAMPLLLITIFMFWLQRSVLGRRGYTTVSGKGGEAVKNGHHHALPMAVRSFRASLSPAASRARAPVPPLA